MDSDRWTSTRLKGSSDLNGCGVLSAAVIVGESAGVHRFRSRAAFARFTGTAPVPVWSGASAGKVRLNRGGNRAMNCALHNIANPGVGCLPEPCRGLLDNIRSLGELDLRNR